MKHEIKHINGSVLYVAEIDDTTPSGLRMRTALEKATRAGADLRGAYLNGAYLRGAYLRGADLRGAYLSDADLSGAYLNGAYLRGAYLRGADLNGAYLRGAYLRGAYLRGDKEAQRLKLIGDRPSLSIGPIGSRSDHLMAYLTDEGVYVQAGCFFDSLNAFRAAVLETHADNQHGREYTAAIAMIEAHAAIWTPAEVAA